jgi:excisionase family DNA binding protein
MTGKLIEIKAAAEQLGISVEKLQALREAGKIHGYKDGASWKFKPEELERVAGELSGQPAVDADDLDLDGSASFSGDDLESLLQLDANSDQDDNLHDSSILISEPLDAGDDQSSSSTLIGKDKGSPGVDDDSDLKLAVESDVSLVADSDEGSDVKVVADDSKASSEVDYDLKLADSEDLSDELIAPEDLDFESDAALVLGDDSHLSPSDDDDAVLADSEADEVAIAAEDSGIGLASPSDSGLSLEDEASAEALELPEDDDMISLRDDLMAASDDSSPLQQDEEFLLSPSDEMLGDESSDSGSQVIALDDSGAFEEDSAVAALDSDEPMLVPDDAEVLEDQLETIDGAAAVAQRLPVASTELPEAEYTAWNLTALLLVVLLLSLTGMLMADIVRNMWSWSGETAVTSGLANSIIESLGMK